MRPNTARVVMNRSAMLSIEIPVLPGARILPQFALNRYVLRPELNVSDVTMNLSKYEIVTLKNKKVRAFSRIGDFFRDYFDEILNT